MSTGLHMRFQNLSRRAKFLIRSLRFYTKNILVDDNYQIGDFTYGRPHVITFTQKTKLKIGKFCSISANVKIFLGANHRTDWVSTYPFPSLEKEWPEAKKIAGHPSSKGDVIIGNDVWIGEGAVIFSGVKIGDGAVIGGRSVVTKNVKPYTVIAGNPAKVIRKRFDDDTIEKLLTIQWWNWPVKKIKNNVHLICSDRVNEFINSFC